MRTLYAFVAVFLLASIIDAAPKPTAKPKISRSVNKRQQRTNPLPLAPNRSSRSKPARAIVPASGTSKNGGKSKRQFPVIFQGGSVYPNYYIQQASPLTDFQNSFLQAAFLSGVHYADMEKYLKNHNFTDSDGKAVPQDAKMAAAFEAAFGDHKSDDKGDVKSDDKGDVKSDVKGATAFKAKVVALEGLGDFNIVNPFLLVKDLDGKLLKTENGVPGTKVGKLGDTNSSDVTLVSPYHNGKLDAVFGPEIAPRYEIHYTPQGVTLDRLSSFAGIGLNSAIGVAPVPPAPVGIAPVVPVVGPLPPFGIYPSFNTLFSPYPYPFLPGYDPKGWKPNGKGDNGKKLDSTEQPAETTSESYQQEQTSESAPSDSAEPTSEASATEQPQ